MESVELLLKRIAKAGGPKLPYLRHILPDWVAHYPPSTPTALLEVKLHIAKTLGLELESLEEGRAVSFATLPTAPKYKRMKGTTEKRLQPAASMIYALARAIAIACPHPYRPLPRDPLELRSEILSGARTVTATNLLSYLWSRGIPVVHYTDWPEGLPRPFAMAVDVDGRPAIIVGSVRKENAWHAFYLAHEAGHIALGHIGRNEILIDAGEADTPGESDTQEGEANEYGLLLLSGSQYPDIPMATSGEKLAEAAKYLGKAQGIDAGHLILRFGVQTGKWGIATLALQQVEPGADAPVVINGDYAATELRFDQLSEERQEYLRRVLVIS